MENPETARAFSHVGLALSAAARVTERGTERPELLSLAMLTGWLQRKLYSCHVATFDCRTLRTLLILTPGANFRVRNGAIVIHRPFRAP